MSENVCDAFRPSPSAVIKAIDEGAFKMQPKETDPHSIPDELLRYIIEDLFRTNEWEIYRNEIANFKNAFLFLDLILEKVLFEELLQLHLLRNPYRETNIHYWNFTR